MHLNIEQKKLVQSKPGGHSLIRGVAGSGKTTVAVNRIPFLLENYCVSKDDRVLMVTFNKSLINYIKYVYEKVQQEKEYETISLFEIDNSKLDIKNIDSLMFMYFMDYCKENNSKLQIEGKKAVLSNIMLKAVVEVKKFFDDVKILDQRYLSFINDEIGWIKACRYLHEEEYQCADRLGRMANQTGDSPQKLQKNSRTRQAIFKVMEMYNYLLKQENKVDFYDMSLIALEQVKKGKGRKYTHIICDESQDLTRVQLEFLYELLNNKECSSVLFVADTAQSIYPHSWLVKGRSFASVGYDVKGRSSSLAKNYRTTTQIAEAAYSLLEKDKNVTDDENFVRPSLLDRQGTYPVFRAFENKKMEADYVIGLIDELSKNYNFGDIAIIARTNEQIKEFGTYFEGAKIPYKVMSKNDGYEFGDDKVKLLTMHSIKGLEFKVVIMVGLNSKAIPLKNVMVEDREYFETMERKLMYVGMTRATEKLYMTTDGTPSKFLGDINHKFLKHDDKTKTSSFYSIRPEDYMFKEKLKDIYSQEEKVRQWIINELRETYKYPSSLIEIEHQVNSFSKIGFVDIAVLSHNKGSKVPYIFVEVKRQGSGLTNCLEQLKSYISTSPTCQYGIATDGIDLLIIDRELEIVEDISPFNPAMLPAAIENYCYVDLKNNTSHSFTRDCSSIKELIFEDERVSEAEELQSLNVFNSIAAGRPIEINSNVEDEFYLPKQWLPSTVDCYMVKVKGDSMINANINDGDLVVLKQQNTANNYEIAAVDLDGNVTLKRFVRMGDTVLLMPENPSYEPINVTEGQIRVLGIAVGVVKNSVV